MVRMPTIVSVQMLRAIAAVAVAAVHFETVANVVAGRGDQALALSGLATGVDLFFVISGFVMVYASANLFGSAGAPSIFIGRRLMRIVPLYWLATAVLIWQFQVFSAGDIAKSLFFIPYRDSHGSLSPILGVGWTLNYEMFFYAVFAATIGFQKNIAVALVAVVLVAVVALGRLTQPANPALLLWSDPIILEFALGMLVGLLRLQGMRLPFLLQVGLLVAATTVLLFGVPTMPPSGARVITCGLPASIIIAACVLGPDLTLGGRTAWLIKMLGDASYAIYLFHPIISTTIMYHSHGAIALTGWSPTQLALAGFSASLVVGVSVHIIFEREMVWRLRRYLLRRSVDASPAV